MAQCYRPLVSRLLGGQDPPASTAPRRPPPLRDLVTAAGPGHVTHVTRDGKGGAGRGQEPGDGPRPVLLSIRRDNLPAPAAARDAIRHENLPSPGRGVRGVLSLGLPLGISSLKLGSRRRRKQKRGEERREVASSCGHQSDGGHSEARGHQHPGHHGPAWYRPLSRSSHTLDTERDSEQEARSRHQSHQSARHAAAGRKSSLPRQQVTAPRYDQLQPRSASVDAETLLAMGRGTPDTELCYNNTINSSNTNNSNSSKELRYAGLTSPSRFMMARDKSSSGNSSGSLDSEAEEAEWTHAAISPQQQQQQQLVLRGRGGRAPAVVVAASAPPPRHLLPAVLRPSPGVKCHPYVPLPQHVARGN